MIENAGPILDSKQNEVDVSGDPRWQLIERVTASATFHKSGRLRELLRYLAYQTICHQAAELAERRIGQAIFGKPADYSPTEDSSVRVHVRQLRLKLHEYFDSEGRNESLIVEIPKGVYTPVFRSVVTAPVPAEVIPPVAVLPPSKVRQIFLQALPWALAGVLAVACAILLAGRTTSPPWPFSAMIEKNARTQIVVSDVNYGLLRMMQRASVSPEAYMKMGFPQPNIITPTSERESRLLTYLDGSLLTSYADAKVIECILSVMNGVTDQVAVRSARDLHLRDLQEGNHIFIGSATSNPWVALYHDKLNFKETERAGEGDLRMKFFKNLKPAAGEKDTYDGLPITGGTGDDYATIAVLPNDTSTGNVMIIQGLRQEGTEAAGRFLANASDREQLRKALGISASGDVPSFEVLLRTQVVSGSPGSTSIVATRRLR